MVFEKKLKLSPVYLLDLASSVRAQVDMTKTQIKGAEKAKFDQLENLKEQLKALEGDYEEFKPLVAKAAVLKQKNLRKSKK